MRRTKAELGQLRGQALILLGSGVSVAEAARELGVGETTMRAWRKRWLSLFNAGRQAAGDGEGADESVATMLRREAPAVARVLLNQAKEGDGRAVALVMKLLGDDLDLSEADDERSRGAASDDLTRELDALPASVAYEIVGLLAAVGSGSAGGDAIAGKTAGEGELGSVQLPWSQDDSASDEGGDEV